MAFLSVWTAAPLSLFCFYWIICNKHSAQESLRGSSALFIYKSNPCLLSHSTLLECGRSLQKSPRLQGKTTSTEHSLAGNIKYLYSWNRQFDHPVALYIPHCVSIPLQAPFSVKYSYTVHNCQEQKRVAHAIFSSMDDEHSIYEGRIIMELKLMHIYESLASSLVVLEQVQPQKVLMGFLELCKLERAFS